MTLPFQYNDLILLEIIEPFSHLDKRLKATIVSLRDVCVI